MRLRPKTNLKIGKYENGKIQQVRNRIRILSGEEEDENKEDQVHNMYIVLSKRGIVCDSRQYQKIAKNI